MNPDSVRKAEELRKQLLAALVDDARLVKHAGQHGVLIGLHRGDRRVGAVLLGAGRVLAGGQHAIAQPGERFEQVADAALHGSPGRFDVALPHGHDLGNHHARTLAEGSVAGRCGGIAV